MTGDHEQLKASILPNNTGSKNITWKSSNENIATVKNGLVVCKNVGTCNITASCEGKTAVCRIVVTASLEYNFNILKNYIKEYGITNSDGNHLIKQIDTPDNNIFEYGIVYDEKNNCFNFVAIFENSGLTQSFAMSVDTVHSNKVPVLMVLVFASTDEGCIGTTNLNALTFSDESKPYFTITSNDTLLSSNDFQAVSQSGLRLSFSCWERLLRSELNMYMSDFGFISYY